MLIWRSKLFQTKEEERQSELPSELPGTTIEYLTGGRWSTIRHAADLMITSMNFNPFQIV